MVLPYILHVILIVKGFLPTWLHDKINEICGTFTSMDKYTGRGDKIEKLLIKKD